MHRRVDGLVRLWPQMGVSFDGIFRIGVALADKLLLGFAAIGAATAGACDHLVVFLGAGVKWDGICKKQLYASPFVRRYFQFIKVFRDL